MRTWVKPWDARLAARLVEPLRDSWIGPNHLTTVRLLVGATSAYLFAEGAHQNLAAALMVLSNFLDHCDGELARISGKATRIGHYYDLVSDATVTVALFVCMGVGLVTSFDLSAEWMGLVAGVAVAGIFQLRNVMENEYGKAATTQPQFSGFDAEDILYLLPLVTWVNGLDSFLLAAAVGAPIALSVVAGQYFALRRSTV